MTRPDGRRIAYVYDAAGRRVARKVNGQTTHRWVWQDGLRIAAEVDAAGNIVARYIHGDRPNVPEAMLKDGRTWRLVSDHLGSVRLVIDAASGQVAQRIDYDEWGQVLSDSNPGFQPFGYAGGLYDPDTGLVRFGARDYDAATGRWTTKDPIGFGGGDSNLYGYVGGNPINHVDADGRDWFRAWSDQRTPYVVGREGHVIVPPGGVISRFIEHCVPAGRTFGKIHDGMVDEQISKGVPDWQANIPTMPKAYWEAFKQEAFDSYFSLEKSIFRLIGSPSGQHQ